jgi:uncharacterized membrane protein YdjX (TVP38/TMEM64 family)
MKRYVLLFLGAGILIVLFFIVRNTSLVSLLDPATVKALVQSYGAYGPLLYIGMYVLACMVFFPGTPLTLAGGALFGPVFGTLYTVIGATIGATCAFYFSRFFSGGASSSKDGGVLSKLSKYDEAIQQNGFLTVLFLRFVPLFPFNGLNFALGLTRIKAKDYILGTLLGIIPGTAVFVFFGDSLSSLSPLKIAVAVACVILLSLLGKFVMNKYKKT